MRQNERKTGKEQYYTKPQDALFLTKKLFEFVDFSDKKFIEPAGGRGAFVDALISLGVKEGNIFSWDIEPLHPLVRKTQNFLLEDLGDLKNCIAITNPPFGRANSLNVNFFNKLSMHCDCIAFISPRSWRKWSVINKLHQNFHVKLDEDISLDYDYANSEQKSKGKLNTCFQIWHRQEQKRRHLSAEDRGYITKTTPAKADVSLTVFGRGCGKWTKDFERIPNTTKMFLVVNEEWVYKALDKIDFSRFYKNTAFVEALSIKEINFLLNEYFDSELA